MYAYKKFPEISDDFRVEHLKVQPGKIRMVLDTDTYNEIDDQFAVVYSLISPERLNVEAIYAAPFFNERSSSPADGMEKSYEEILRVLDKMKIKRNNFVFRGSKGYLQDYKNPYKSDAAEDLIKRAMGKGDPPLYVAAIGAATNIASAILIEPGIIEKIVVVWLCGHSLNWKDTKEFNLVQDILASRLIFDCGIPLVHIPCQGVASHLHTNLPEIEKYVGGKGEIGNYLTDIFREFLEDHHTDSKVLWDIAPIAYLINELWIKTDFVNSPVITDNLTWGIGNSRHLIRSACKINRDAVFKDFFGRLEEFTL